MKPLIAGLNIVQLIVSLAMLFLVGKLALILWHWGVWQDLFGIGR